MSGEDHSVRAASALGRLRLLQLSSQALPTGAFAYSCGLETAHDLGYLSTLEQCTEFLSSLMYSALAQLELPIFKRMRAAVQAEDAAQLTWLSAYLLANRESMELREQDGQMARALRRVLSALHPHATLPKDPQTFSEMLAHASCLFEITDDDADLLVVYTWLEQQVSALCRLIPLGPTAGQTLLNGVLVHAPRVLAQSAHVLDDDIGASSPSLAIFSSLHETQYTRIFRS
jgi:urease accessory protein